MKNTYNVHAKLTVTREQLEALMKQYEYKSIREALSRIAFEMSSNQEIWLDDIVSQQERENDEQ